MEATLYLATAPKSNSAGAYFKAFQLIEQEGKVEVPRHLQDGNRDAAALGRGGVDCFGAVEGMEIPV